MKYMEKILRFDASEFGKGLLTGMSCEQLLKKAVMLRPELNNNHRPFQLDEDISPCQSDEDISSCQSDEDTSSCQSDEDISPLVTLTASRASNLYSPANSTMNRQRMQDEVKTLSQPPSRKRRVTFMSPEPASSVSGLQARRKSRTNWTQQRTNALVEYMNIFPGPWADKQTGQRGSSIDNCTVSPLTRVCYEYDYHGTLVPINPTHVV